MDDKYQLNRIYTTADGNHVRSKSEVIISDLLYGAGIKYKYEEKLERNMMRVGKQENIKRIVDSLQEMQYVMREIAGQLKFGDFSLSGDSYQELRRDYLALVVTVVDIINVAAYLFDKTQDRANQHWKADLEWDRFRNALEIQGNDLGSGKV